MTGLDFTTLAFAAAFLGTVFRRKAGPFNAIQWFRERLSRCPEPLHTIANCDLCAIFWIAVILYSVSLAMPTTLYVWRVFAIAGLAAWLAPTLEVKIPFDE